MNIHFWRNKPQAFAKMWKERGFLGAIYASADYIWRRLKQVDRYQEWLQENAFTTEDAAQAQAEIATWTNPPTFSVLVPVYNTDPALLSRCIESVRSQVYPHWQLCLVDDCSSAEQPRQILQAYAEQDERIQTIFLETNSGIATATNAALAIATGDYVAFLDHDDELAVNALYENARVLHHQPEIDILYSDEDMISEAGTRHNPFFKPDWSPDYFHGCMYTCHLGVFRTSLVRAVRGLRSEYDGAQDWDLMLRAVEKSSQIHHIPKILYHWRMTSTSVTSGSEAKPWAYDAAQRALVDMVQRSRYPGDVEALPDAGFYRVRRRLTEQPLISIVIPSAGKLLPDQKRSLLENCLHSIISRSTYPKYEFVVVDGFDLPDEVVDRIKALGSELVRCDQPFNFSQRINLGVAHSKGEIVVLLNDDVEVQSPDWLETMLELAQQTEIGAVGAKLLFPNSHIQHAGVVILGGCPGHVFYNINSDHPGYFFSNLINRNYLGVTGACLMVRRQVFDEVGGLDEVFPLNYNDVDFCLKLYKAGYRNVFTPFAKLTHYESASRHSVVLPEELETFQTRWRSYLEAQGGDPYYNLNLRQDNANFVL